MWSILNLAFTWETALYPYIQLQLVEESSFKSLKFLYLSHLRFDSHMKLELFSKMIICSGLLVACTEQVLFLGGNREVLDLHSGTHQLSADASVQHLAVCLSKRVVWLHLFCSSFCLASLHPISVFHCKVRNDQMMSMVYLHTHSYGTEP